MRLQANRILMDPRRKMVLDPQLDCTEIWGWASLNERIG